MAIAIEPMISAGDYNIKTKKDGWTVVMSDGTNGAHFEHTVLVTSTKPLIVTE
jgi:methionyl aminopeptidase